MLCLTSLVCAVVLGNPSPQATPSGRFARPPIHWDEKNDRAVKQPAWLRFDWNPKADAPFKPIYEELAPFRTFNGFDTKGVWARKTMAAYNDWIEDPQNPVKLYRVSAYFGILNGVDNALQGRPSSPSVGAMSSGAG